MASIKLGAVVADISGSIGGTTFRRTQSGHIAYNKQSKQLKSASNINSQRIKIGSIMQNWSNLSQATRDIWTYQATLYTFNNKFGEKKNISGRELFIKLNSQLLPLGESVSDPTLMESTVEFPQITSLSIGVDDTLAEVFFLSTLTNVKICVSFYPLRKTKGVKPHAHFKVNKTYNVVGTNTIDVWTAFVNAFPLYSVGMNVGCNIYAVNEFGFKSPVTSIAVTTVDSF